MGQFYTANDHFSILPALMLALFGCAVLLFDFLLFPDPRQRKFLLIFVVIAEIFTGYALYKQQMYLAAGSESLAGFGGSVDGGCFGRVLQLDLRGGGADCLAGLVQYLEIAGEHHGEYYSLILFAQCGMYFWPQART